MSAVTAAPNKAVILVKVILAGLFLLAIIFVPFGFAAYGVVDTVQNGFNWFASLSVLIGGYIFLNVLSGLVSKYSELRGRKKTEDAIADFKAMQEAIKAKQSV